MKDLVHDGGFLELRVHWGLLAHLRCDQHVGARDN